MAQLGPALPLALALARSLHFCATAVLLGGGGLLVLISGPAARTAERFVRAAAALAVFSGVAWLAATLVNITGEAASLVTADDWEALWDSVFGPPWATRLLLLAGCGALALARQRWASGATAILAAGLAVDQAWLGHGAIGSGSSGGLLLASHALHALAAYAWTGALPVLALLLLAQPLQAADARRALALFSTLGLAAVATILATGLMNAAYHAGPASALLATAYGWILTVKIVLFTAMLLIALLNRATAARLDQSATHPPRRLLAGVVLEAGVGVLVLSAAAILGMTAPP